jgi:L-ascorbate metabolism protein UlaG (beta-lactamase superfamily)
MTLCAKSSLKDADGARTMFLRPDANVELLCCRWHAWQHTLSPVQHAMNLAYRQIPLLESFIENPAVHVAHSADPALLGGPFVDLPASKVVEIKTLLEITKQRCGNLLELAGAFREVNAMLSAKGKGHSLDALYDTLPEALRGVVEFAYDIHSAPVMKIREEMLRGDARYTCNFREVALTRIEDTKRNFFINTPKVLEPEDVILPMEFNSRALHAIADSRLHPVNLSQLGHELGLNGNADSLAPFFTEERPVRLEPDYRGAGVRVRYFGHACVEVQSASTSVLMDPRFAFERTGDLATLTYYDLPDEVDYVFISHAHQDHFCPETLAQLRGRVGRFLVPRNNRGSPCDPSMKLTLQELGFRQVEAMDDLQVVDIPGGHIVSLPFPGEHCGLEILSKHCALVVLEGVRILFLVDSDAVDPSLYRLLKRHIGAVDALFIGMECNGAPASWLYGPLLQKAITRRDDESRRGNGSNCDRAWRVVQEIDCSNIYVYAMGMEPWNNHLLGLEYSPDSIQINESNALVERCRAAGLNAERLKGCREFLFGETTEKLDETIDEDVARESASFAHSNLSEGYPSAHP